MALGFEDIMDLLKYKPPPQKHFFSNEELKNIKQKEINGLKENYQELDKTIEELKNQKNMDFILEKIGGFVEHALLMHNLADTIKMGKSLVNNDLNETSKLYLDEIGDILDDMGMDDDYFDSLHQLMDNVKLMNKTLECKEIDNLLFLDSYNKLCGLSK